MVQMGEEEGKTWVVPMGEEEGKTWVVPRAEDQSTVVLWAGAADKGMGAV